jgi:hypothetical protein
MSSICYYGGVRHKHDSALEARACHIRNSVVPQPAPQDPEHSTQRQRDYIVALGGDLRAANLMTKRVASRYIDALRSPAVAAASLTHVIPAATDRHPTASVPVEPPARVPVPVSKPVTSIPLGLLEAIPAAHYAVRADSNEPYTFLRVRKPKTGRYTGCTIIQTRHGDRFITRFALFPNGRVWFSPGDQRFIESKIMLVFGDYQYAMMEYGREIGRCMVCGKTLTDERSRWYGIGPDCETRYSFPVERLDEEFGPWFLGKVR